MMCLLRVQCKSCFKDFDYKRANPQKGRLRSLCDICAIDSQRRNTREAMKSSRERLKHCIKVIPDAKKCSGCKKALPSSCFHKSSRTRSGLRDYCKMCQKEKSAEQLKKHRDKFRARCSNRRAMMKGAEGKHTADEIYALKCKQGFKCKACGATPKVWHADHIVPLIKGGSNWISNIQMLCSTCNQKKHAKDNDEFMKEFLNDTRR